MSEQDVNTLRAHYRALDAREETIKADLAEVRRCKSEIAHKLLMGQSANGEHPTSNIQHPTSNEPVGGMAER